jgi:short subunit dehydrogenase-like uncharacterized protein
MHHSPEILLAGAYGYTARLIAEQLSRSGIAFAIAGRDEEKLAEMKSRFPLIHSVHIIDFESEVAVEALLTRFRFVINCVGPYNVLGNLVLQKSIEAGCGYIDISGEQHYVYHSMENMNAMALESGACVFHSVAFESALADLLAKVKLPVDETWKSISTIYHFEKSRPSPGTRATMLTSQHFPVYRLENGELIQGVVAGFAKDVENLENRQFDAVLFAPYPEVLFYRKHYKVENACSYLLTNRFEAKFLTAGKLPKGSLETTLEETRKRARKGPAEQERLNQAFEIRLLAENSAGMKYGYLLKGKDMYGVTASIAEIFTGKLMSLPQMPAGIFTPADIADAAEIFNEILEKNMLECTEHIDITIL